MTFEQFIATRKWSDNLANDCDTFGPYEANDVQPGFIYCDSLFIEQVADWWPQDARDQGGWHLLIERDEYITNDLDALERRLYRWAMNAGYGEDQPTTIPEWEAEADRIAAKWVARIGGGFHPDTRGADYVWFGKGGLRLLTDAEAAEYDGDMDRLFAIAADPYENGIRALHDANPIARATRTVS